jgi:uncharacterized protein involved in type VI secretion and phage assembly
MMVDDQALADLCERIRGCFYGKYRGIVSAVDAATCRIKAKIPSVLGDAESGWCLPCVPYAGPQVGVAFLPEEGSAVWIEFEGGDVSYPIWVGGFWREGETPNGVAADVKVIASKSSLRIVFDDGQQTITVTDASGNTLALGPGGATITNSDQQIAVTSASVSVDNGALEVI